MGCWVFTATSSETADLIYHAREEHHRECCDRHLIKLCLKRLVEPAIVDFDPAVLRGVEDVGVAVSEANIEIIVRLSCVNGLRRNDIISRHHHRERDVECAEVVRGEPVKRACL